MIHNPNQKELTHALINAGLPEREAQDTAREIILNSQQMQPGVSFGGVDLHEILTLITRANRANVRSLTLCIECAGGQYEWHDYQITIREAQRWEERPALTLEERIKARINDLEQSRDAILNRKLENIIINAPVALEQINTKSRLDELYSLLGQARPEYPSDHE